MSADKQPKTKGEPKIKRNMLIAEMAEKYPDIINFLIYEYNFHCVGCIVSGFEELEDGAKVHGIEGEDFEEMLKIINEMVEE